MNVSSNSAIFTGFPFTTVWRDGKLDMAWPNRSMKKGGTALWLKQKRPKAKRREC
jgi:hypothetical protein